ncbi:MAG: hypothetical protein ABL883_08310 [Terricaulis sp.]
MIEQTLTSIFDVIGSAILTEIGSDGVSRTRLHTLLADGADQIAADEALRRGWEIIAPLPVGAGLYCAINSRPTSETDAKSVLSNRQPADSELALRVATLRKHYGNSNLFELRDADASIEALYFTALTSADSTARAAFEASMSARVAMAARIVLEQSDVILAIWDRAQTNFVGGTGHTVQVALEMGAAVICVDPAAPQAWRLLRAPETLTHPAPALSEAERCDQLTRIVRDALAPQVSEGIRHSRAKSEHKGAAALDAVNWRARSNPLWHAYRRVEALFGGDGSHAPLRSLRQTYEPPATFAQRAGAPILDALREAPGADLAFVDRVANLILPRFAWADGISAYLSDTYRGGMTINFILSAVAIIGGIAYLPLLGSESKWGFALFELVLLSAILFITHLGQKKRWHGRWFETRRAAEYLRHAPLLLALGAARAPGRWPRGADTMWPEWYARHALREVGLPRQHMTNEHLRYCLGNLLDRHVVQQRDYHHGKARRLTNVHHNLDRLSETLFQLAVASVALFLAFQIGAWLQAVDDHTLKDAAKIFTFLGVALPTLGGSIAGIRYFGDFERFAAISEVAAQKLGAVHERIEILLRAPDEKLDYASVANLAHAADDIVVSEIENWQAVFGGKQITVPV